MGKTSEELHRMRDEGLPLSGKCNQCGRLTYFTREEVARCLQTKRRLVSQGMYDQDNAEHTYIHCAYGCKCFDMSGDPVPVHRPE